MSLKKVSSRDLNAIIFQILLRERWNAARTDCKNKELELAVYHTFLVGRNIHDIVRR